MKNFSNYKDYDKKEDWRIGSKVVHGALGGEPVTGSVSFPIFQTATFKFRGLGDSLGFDYTRCQNPTIEELEPPVLLILTTTVAVPVTVNSIAPVKALSSSIAFTLPSLLVLKVTLPTDLK